MTGPSSSNGDDVSLEPEGAAPPNGRTPIYEANHLSRYHRQGLIRKIRARTERVVLCYVSGEGCSIDREDTPAFVDLLHNVPADRHVDLLVHTGGGSVDAAEKLMRMLRKHASTAEIRIVVPDYAKSAGTVMVLGADRVVMSDMSELGPIDPQAFIQGEWRSVHNYLDAYREHAETLAGDPSNMAAQIMLGQLDPSTLKMCEAGVDRARQVAEDLLRRGMFRDGGNWSKVVEELLNTSQWLSHGQMISWEDASHIGLQVEYLRIFVTSGKATGSYIAPSALLWGSSKSFLSRSTCPSSSARTAGHRNAARCTGSERGHTRRLHSPSSSETSLSEMLGPMRATGELTRRCTMNSRSPVIRVSSRAAITPARSPLRTSRGEAAENPCVGSNSWSLSSSRFSIDRNACPT